MEDKNSSASKESGRTISVAIIGGAVIAVLLIVSTLWINHRGQSDTSDAVHSVSEMYLRELTDRREAAPVPTFAAEPAPKLYELRVADEEVCIVSEPEEVLRKDVCE